MKEENAKKDATLENIGDVLRAMGMPEAMISDTEQNPPMIVLSNYKRTFGAYSIIAKLDELKERFTNGFIVLPSSVHEVIVVEVPDGEELDNMVQEVNDGYVNLEEQLSGHAYRIA